jgi:hypothetical protein
MSVTELNLLELASFSGSCNLSVITFPTQHGYRLVITGLPCAALFTITLTDAPSLL